MQYFQYLPFVTHGVLIDTSLSYVQSRQARLTSTVELFKALGGGWVAANQQ
jgi:outer membrane protein TolC